MPPPLLSPPVALEFPPLLLPPVAPEEPPLEEPPAAEAPPFDGVGLLLLLLEEHPVTMTARPLISAHVGKANRIFGVFMISPHISQ